MSAEPEDAPLEEIQENGSGDDIRRHSRPTTLPHEKIQKMKGKIQDELMEMTGMRGESFKAKDDTVELANLTIHQCARDGDEGIMRQLLASYQTKLTKRINGPDDEKLTALHYASRYNHYGIVKMLLDAGARYSDADEEGATPLHFAARYKRMRILDSQAEDVEENSADDDEADDSPVNMPVIKYDSTVENSVILYLVSCGADVNVKDIYGSTALNFAAMRGNEVAVKELMSCAGVDIECMDKQLMRPLHLAASHNHLKIVQMLLEAGASLHCADEENGTPLHYACMEGNVKIVQLLFDAAEMSDMPGVVEKMVEDVDNQNNAALHMAVESRCVEVTRLLLNKGADVNKRSINNSTPLHLAAAAGEVSIVDMLLISGARVDARDQNQMTPLHKAAAHNHADVVRCLLAKGARIYAHDKDNFSPLLIAASFGHFEVIDVLLASGADYRDVDKNDKTIIYWAAEENHLDALRALMKRKAMKELVDIPDRYENTPMHVAAQKGYMDVVQALLEMKAHYDAKNEEEQTPLHLAAENGRSNIVRLLVKRNKLLVQDEDEDSNTPLHLAALAGHRKTVQTLIDANADIEARNCTLWTPLDCAAARGYAKVVQVLLEADAPVDPMDRTKTTPLHLASSRGHVEVINVLLLWGASVSQRDSEGNNCLDLAIDNGHKKAAEVLIQSDKWRDALSNNTTTENLHSTPMRKLICKMPDVAEMVFTRCTSTNMSNPSHPDYEITFHFQFLDDAYANWSESQELGDNSSVTDLTYDDSNGLRPGAQPYSNDSLVLKKNHPLMLMVANNQQDLLMHPLVTSLLRHKWNSFGRKVYYFNLFSYCVFLALLTAYIVTTTAPYTYMEKLRLLQPLGNFSRANFTCEAASVFTDKQEKLAAYGKYIIMALAALNLLREIFQIMTAKWGYLGWENLIEWVTYVTSLLLVIDFSDCQQTTGIRMEWQWQLAAVTIFFGWFNLVLFVRKFPRFGIYIVMFTDIFLTFSQFFPVFFLFIIGFALAFNVLLANRFAFRSPESSLLKTSVMMIGELEFADLFHSHTNINSASVAELTQDGMFYRGLTYALYVAFLILMAILVTNLLVGLAVDDIKAVQEQAVLKRLAMQVEMALDVESILPQFIRRLYIVKSGSVRPNEMTRLTTFLRALNLESRLSSEQIAKALHPDLDRLDQLKEDQDELRDTVTNVRNRIKAMAAQNQRVEEMLVSLLKAQGIEYSPDDFSAN